MSRRSPRTQPRPPVPAATPPAIVSVDQAIVKSLARQAVRERIAAVGAEVIGNSPEEFGAFLKSEFASWAKVIKEGGITIE